MTQKHVPFKIKFESELSSQIPQRSHKMFLTHYSDSVPVLQICIHPNQGFSAHKLSGAGDFPLSKRNPIHLGQDVGRVVFFFFVFKLANFNFPHRCAHTSGASIANESLS